MNNKRIDAFISLAKLFRENGYKLYLVGGTVRDYLLNKELSDMDVVTDATPEQVQSFYHGKASYTFMKYGSVTLYFNDVKFDLTTLRKERSYFDSRHPTEIEFVKSLRIDHKRRDFTINGMYLDEKFNLFDYSEGKKDLENHVIKMIGSPDRRIKEDPLRILRAIRFALTLSFDLDEKLKKSMKQNINLLSKLNPDKIKQELRKIPEVDETLKFSLFNEFDVIYLLDMVK